MRILFTTIGLVIWMGCLAHNPTETHSKIYLKDGNIQIEIEFPWTISEAVKMQYPGAKDNLSKTEFLQYLKNYVVSNLIIKQNGKTLQLVGFREIVSDQLHSASLLLSFSSNELTGLEITNTLMFNLNQRQKNLHTVYQKNGFSTTFYTSTARESFNNNKKGLITSVPGNSTMVIILFSLFLISMLGYLGLSKKIRSFTNPPDPHSEQLNKLQS